MNAALWSGKKVFMTGHTGFKGGWLTLWLKSLGAEVHGYSTAAPTEPNLFTVARVEEALASHVLGDIRDAAALTAAMHAAQPQFIFHLAAQPLVRLSYREPIETFAVNVMGTANVLEAVRTCESVRQVVIVTTDKCYDNKEWNWGYRETEPLGGRDPYSSSKACAELVTAAYRDSFLACTGVGVATARAGNVIGGGDWAPDRLLPDFFRAATSGRSVEIRHPDSTRPWQHVLEPLCGYLMLAQALAIKTPAVSGAWNFGPADADTRPVRWILDRLCGGIPGSQWRQVDVAAVHEARSLKLDSAKAAAELGWHPRWGLERALDETIAWHRAWRGGQDMQAVCQRQISGYQHLD